jgi:pimeloyl-ACP methyl ester carboxylesterase
MPHARVDRISTWFAAVLCVSLAACNVVRMSERRMDRTLHRTGLSAQIWHDEDRTIQYWRGGTGPPLLLLHGFGGDARWGWHPQVEAFARDRTLIVPDLLGFGGSSWNGPTPSIEHQADCVASLLDHEDLEPATVVGISYGGLVAWQLATRHPDRVSQLVLVDSPGPAYGADDLDALLVRFDEPDAANIIVPAAPADVRRLLALAYEQPPRAPNWALRQVHRDIFVPRASAQRALIGELIAGIDHYAAQPRVPEVPTLLIWGRDDPVFPLAIAERLTILWPDAELVVIDHARHAPNLEHPRAFNEALTRFLDTGSP